MSAIGGFGTGLAQGLRLGSDIAESAQKSQLIGMQVKELQRDNQMKDELAALWRGKTGAAPTAPTDAASQPSQEGGSAQPPVTSNRIESPITEGGFSPQPAIAPPPAPSNTPSPAGVGIANPQTSAVPTTTANSKSIDLNNLEHLGAINAESNAILAKYGKISPLQIAQQSEAFSKLKASGAFRAAQDFMTHGDVGKARAEFAKAGYDFPEGTTFEVKNTPIAPGLPAAKNVVVTTPDGRIFDSNSIMRSAMDLDKVAQYDLNVAVAAQDAKYKMAVVGESVRHNKIMEGIQQKTLDQTVKYQNADLFIKENAQLNKEYTDKEQLAISRETMEATWARVNSLREQGAATIKLSNEQFDALKDERARKAALEEAAISQKNLARFSGYDMNVNDKTIAQWKELGTKEAKDMITQHEAGLSKWLSLINARELNLDPETKKQRFTDAELVTLARDNPKLDFTYNKDIGLWSAQYNGKQLFVAKGAYDPEAKMTNAMPTAAQPVAAQPPARVGINPPPASSQTITGNNPIQPAAPTVIDAATQANAQREPNRIAALEPLRKEAARFTPEFIKTMPTTEAAAARTKYADVLTAEQMGMLLRRSRQ